VAVLALRGAAYADEAIGWADIGAAIGADIVAAMGADIRAATGASGVAAYAAGAIDNSSVGGASKLAMFMAIYA